MKLYLFVVQIYYISSNVPNKYFKIYQNDRQILKLVAYCMCESVFIADVYNKDIK